MRRAERAGRERAGAFLTRYGQLSSPFGPHAFATRINLNLAQVPEPHKVYNPTKEDLGAHQLSGRALKAALEAYDRGYRARLEEALVSLNSNEKKEGTS